MTWTGFTINGVFKDLSHLQTKVMPIDIGGNTVLLNVSYGSHCFSDEKENDSKLSLRNEVRYWSEERYCGSLELPKILSSRFDSDSYVVAYYKTKKNGEQYHYMGIHDYAIFFEITKPVNLNNTLNIKVISAYQKDSWGEMPKGKAYKIRWILGQRLEGNSILKNKKR